MSYRRGSVPNNDNNRTGPGDISAIYVRIIEHRLCFSLCYLNLGVLLNLTTEKSRLSLEAMGDIHEIVCTMGT